MTVAPWMQTLSGGVVDLRHPAPSQIVTSDMIVALSRIPRYNGHSLIVWSVAAHSLLVAELVRRTGAAPLRQLYALLHDAHEAYTGDIIAPMATAINHAIDDRMQDGGGYVFPIPAIKGHLQQAVHAHLGLPDPSHSDQGDIEHADAQALEIERTQIMAPCARPWGPLPQTDDPPVLRERPAAAVQLDFRTRLERLLHQADLPACPDLWGRRA